MDKNTGWGMLLPGFILLGLGIGMALGNTGAGVLIGVGVGFISSAIIQGMRSK
ncbi:hypothetical protein [Thermoactinomyces sp. DSM 45891]|uniref:hypothetical protein n=1 Tax=Thermoactinomyces sp. DSM 45891 TaxID=1761907 RepID=UPI0015A6FE28|nr:hypothetical protein [Thermoactinomyces sp. DSM 45891]